MKIALEHGFTALRDLETEGAMYTDVDVKRAINNGVIAGPRLFVSTRAMSVTGGYGPSGYSPEISYPMGVQIVDGVEGGRKAVREQIAHGAPPGNALNAEEDSPTSSPFRAIRCRTSPRCSGSDS